jgi:hypothetical protein
MWAAFICLKVKCGNVYFLRFQVLTAVCMKMAAFWIAAPCSLVKCTDVSEALSAPVIRAMSALLDDGD